MIPILHAAGRIAVFGMGPSAAIARYIAILLNRSGRRVARLDVSGIMFADQLLDLRKGDAVLALEIVVLALAACDQNLTLAQLERLNALRTSVLGEQRNVLS